MNFFSKRKPLIFHYLSKQNLKQAKSRRDQYSGGGAPSSLPPAAMSGPHHQGSVLLADEQCAIDMSDTALQQQQQQKTMMLYEDQSEQFIQSRADTMQNIESTIVELGGIFQQLAHMVQEQEEMVERLVLFQFRCVQVIKLVL